MDELGNIGSPSSWLDLVMEGGSPWRGKPIHTQHLHLSTPCYLRLMTPSWLYFPFFTPSPSDPGSPFPPFLSFHSLIPHSSYLYPRYPLKTLAGVELCASGIPTLVPAIDISAVCFPSLWCREEEGEIERELVCLLLSLLLCKL